MVSKHLARTSSEISSRLTKELSRLQTAKSLLVQERKALAKADDQIVYAEHAQKLAQETAQQIQQHAHKRIASVVSRCLEAVFQHPYKFKIEFERKRGRTEARLVFVRDGEEIDPMTGSGGGVIDVAAFALRLSCMLLTRPPVRRVVMLDEPFKHLKPAEVYGPRIVQLLKMLTKEFKVQFVMVQNLAEFQTGRIFEIETP